MMELFKAFNSLVYMVESFVKYIRMQLYLKSLKDFQDDIDKDDIDALKKKLSDSDGSAD